MDSKVKVDEFLWAKVKGYPPWPCVVVEPGPNVPEKPAPNTYWVYFFGSHNYTWVEENHLKPYEAFKDTYTSLHKTLALKKAVSELDSILEERVKDPNYKFFIEPFKHGRNTTKRSTNIVRGDSKRQKYVSHNFTETESSASSPQCNSSCNVDTDDITTSQLTFGVLGVGIIGSRIVKNLINSGHKVNIWNRTLQRCTEIESLFQSNSSKTHLKTYFTPRGLLENSDIVLNCVSDYNVLKKIVQNYFSVNNSNEILSRKGFVEIASIDPETSKDLRDMIKNKGGRYLEAQFQGSETEAGEGKVVILTAGSTSLFFDCQSCFKAIANSAFFLGDVGYATKINLILQLIRGVCLVGLTEGFALAERCGIAKSPKFLEIFNLTNLASSYLNGKAAIIFNNNFNKVEHSLLNMQKDMYFGLQLSNQVQQPMELASVANEIFKRCQRFDLNDKDASSVFLRARF